MDVLVLRWYVASSLQMLNVSLFLFSIVTIVSMIKVMMEALGKNISILDVEKCLETSSL